MANRKMAILSVVAALLLGSGARLGRQPSTDTVIHTSYWQQRVALFRELPQRPGLICFVGDSLTDGGEWSELTGLAAAVNRGIVGDTAWGLWARLDEIVSRKPAMVFLLIGINDLFRCRQPVAAVRDKIGDILAEIAKKSAATQVFLQSVLPVQEGRMGIFYNSKIDALNVALQKLAQQRGVTWIDLAPLFKDKSGHLQSELTIDGLHLNGRGYAVWYQAIRRFLPAPAQQP